MGIDWKAYQTNGFFDELIDGQGADSHTQVFLDLLRSCDLIISFD